jgi:hypothetical protein
MIIRSKVDCSDASALLMQLALSLRSPAMKGEKRRRTRMGQFKGWHGKSKNEKKESTPGERMEVE